MQARYSDEGVFGGVLTAGGGAARLSSSRFPSLNGQLVPRAVTAEVDCQVDMAFVHLRLEFAAPGGAVRLDVPTNNHVTVTGCQAVVGRRLYETMCVPRDEAAQLAKERPADASMGGSGETQGRYNPECFSLPLGDAPAGETITVDVYYMEKLLYAGNYLFLLPLDFPRGTQQPAIGLRLTVNTGTPHCRWQNCTYPVVVRTQTDRHMELVLDVERMHGHRGGDLYLSYDIRSPQIFASAIVEPPSAASFADHGTFLVNVSPPAQPTTFLARNIVFLLDHSYSMSGESFERVREAMVRLLPMLGPHDGFNVIAFNHMNTAMVDTGMLPATPEHIRDAQQWVRAIQPSGGTDIRAPMQRSLQMLSQLSGSGKLPFIFLMTDGAVGDEHEIVNDVIAFNTNAPVPVRVNTLGVGPYCNAMFLEMLALHGRGFSDIVLDSASITNQLLHLARVSNAPILSNIQLQIQGASDVELLPPTIPDLFLDAPIQIVGRYRGVFPPTVRVHGVLANGTALNFDVVVESAPQVPIYRLYAKSFIDARVAAAWLGRDERLRNEAIDCSARTGIPCAHTSMVAYETTPAKKAELAQKKRSGTYKGLVIASAIGGVLILGAVAAQFGSPAATISNLSPTDAMDSLAGAGDVFIEGFGSAAESLYSAAGSAVEAVTGGECCECGPCKEVTQCLGCECDTCQGWATDACNSCGNAGTLIKEAANTCSNCLAAPVSAVKSCFNDGGACDDCGKCCSAIPELFAGILSLLGELIGGIGACVGDCAKTGCDSCNDCGDCGGCDPFS